MQKTSFSVFTVFGFVRVCDGCNIFPYIGVYGARGYGYNGSNVLGVADHGFNKN